MFSPNMRHTRPLSTVSAALHTANITSSSPQEHQTLSKSIQFQPDSHVQQDSIVPGATAWNQSRGTDFTITWISIFWMAWIICLSVQTWRVDVSWAIFCRALRFRSTASLRARSGKLQVLIQSWSKNLSCKFIQILCLLEHHRHVVWWCLLQFLIVLFHPFPNSVQSLLWSTGFSGLTTSSACPWAMGIWRQVASWHTAVSALPCFTRFAACRDHMSWTWWEFDDTFNTTQRVMLVERFGGFGPKSSWIRGVRSIKIQKSQHSNCLFSYT